MSKRRFTSVVASIALMVSGSNVASADPNVCDSFQSSYHLACPFNAAGLQQSAMISQVTLMTALVLTNMLTQMLTGGPRKIGLGTPDQTGVAAQSAGSRWNAWGGLVHGDMANKFVPASSSSDSYVALGGVDYTFRNNAVAGLSLSYDTTKTDTSFNGGTFESEGASLAAYLAYPFSRSLLFDASIGIGSANLESSSRIPFPIPNAHSKDERWFAALSLSHITPIQKWLLTLKGSLLHSEDTVKEFFSPVIVGPIGQKDTVRLTQVRLGVQAAYDMGTGWQPYAGLTYINDVQRESQPNVGGGFVPANDRDAWNIAVGLNIFGKGAVSGGIQANFDVDRRETRNNQLMGNIAIRF